MPVPATKTASPVRDIPLIKLPEDVDVTVSEVLEAVTYVLGKTSATVSMTQTPVPPEIEHPTTLVELLMPPPDNTQLAGEMPSSMTPLTAVLTLITFEETPNNVSAAEIKVWGPPLYVHDVSDEQAVMTGMP